MNPYKLKPHPYSEIFPPASGDDYDHLLASIKRTKKLRYKIIIYQNMILDGNQRLRACREARIEPGYIEFNGTDQEALDMVWDLNAGRRNMSASQKAIAAAKYATLEVGRPKEKCGHVTTLDEAAEKAGVGKTTIQRAKEVLEHGSTEQIRDVREGKKTVTEAAREIRSSAKNNKGDNSDNTGTLLTDAARQFWNRIPEAKNVLAQISAARGQVKKCDPSDPMWSEVNLNGVLSDLNGAYNRFAAAVPAHVCPYCKGVKPEKCKCCKGRGVISEYMWKTAIPEEIKKKASHPF